MTIIVNGDTVSVTSEGPVGPQGPAGGQGGTTGHDASINQPAVPNYGQAFGGAGPYALWTPYGSLAANHDRFYIEIQNQSWLAASEP
jgi:hypothetical protein